MLSPVIMEVLVQWGQQAGVNGQQRALKESTRLCPAQPCLCMQQQHTKIRAPAQPHPCLQRILLLTTCKALFSARPSAMLPTTQPAPTCESVPVPSAAASESDSS